MISYVTMSELENEERALVAEIARLESGSAPHESSAGTATVTHGREHSPPEDDGVAYQRCGGGRRIIRKAIK